MAVRYYSHQVEGRHLGLLRHRTAGEGAGVEYLDHSGRWARGRSVVDLHDLDEVDSKEAALIARRQYGVSLTSSRG